MIEASSNYMKNKTGEKIFKKINELSSEGFEILKKVALPKEIPSTKKFDDLTQVEIKQIQDLIKKSTDTDLKDIKKNLNDIDDIFIGPDLDDPFSKGIKRQVDFLNRLADVNKHHQKKLNDINKNFFTSTLNSISSFLKKI